MKSKGAENSKKKSKNLESLSINDPPEIPKELDELIEELEEVPEDKREVLRAISQQRYYAGPVPPPEMLAEYDKLIPNGADRLLILAERQT